MRLAAGSRLGPYEITGPLGAGGMGEVYRARDTRLERTVAIKILPPQVSADPVRKQRFEREAKTISGLNHPNICVLHDVGSQDGVDYLVMECVEGETLAQRLEKGALPLEQVLKYGAQIADALDKAHRSGVVHRDLKPGNIMLTKSGAKLLDFGLAKPVAALVSGATMTAASSPVTEEGTIVGTFPYMSPEQVEGKELDGRSDIFSLGAVLYEMLMGQRAFQGKSQLSVSSAILEKEPVPISTVKPMTPPVLDHAIRRCLAKDPEERWQTARDLAIELKWIPESGGAVNATMPPVTKRREKLAWLICCALGVSLLVVAALWWRNAKPSQRTVYFSAPLSFPARDVVFAPNGRILAVVGNEGLEAKNTIFLYEVGSRGARKLVGTEGATYPFWSADGRSLAFFADGKLKRLEISGGPVQAICDAPSARGGTWNKDGVIVFAPNATGGTVAGLYRVSASGGKPTQISTPDAQRNNHRWPMFLPDGTHFLYMAANFSGLKGVDAIFVGSLDSEEKHFVVEAGANAAYAAPGYLLFYRNNALMAQRFDLKSLTVSGEPTTILSDLQYQLQVKRAVFAVSDEGSLVVQTGSGVTLSQLTWFDRKGKEAATVGQPGVYANVFVAPNGKSVALDKRDIEGQNTDIWTHDLEHDSAKRLTFNPAFEAVPIWSPDSARLVFSSNRQSKPDLYMKNSDGGQEEKVIVEGELNKFPNDWSRDGKYILYTRDTDLWVLTVPELKSSLFLKGPSVLRNGQFSPDEKWVAYASNETGKWEIYVTSFPGAQGKWQVSTHGGEQPRWRGDGKELFYLSPDGNMMAAVVTTGNNFDAATPVVLFRAAHQQPIAIYDLFVYDVSRDGQRFLINTPTKLAETGPMSVILNWTAELNK